MQLIAVYLIITDLLRFGNMQEYLSLGSTFKSRNPYWNHGGPIKIGNGKFPGADPFLNCKRWPGQALNHFPSLHRFFLFI